MGWSCWNLPCLFCTLGAKDASRISQKTSAQTTWEDVCEKDRSCFSDSSCLSQCYTLVWPAIPSCQPETSLGNPNISLGKTFLKLYEKEEVHHAWVKPSYVFPDTGKTSSSTSCKMGIYASAGPGPGVQNFRIRSKSKSDPQGYNLQPIHLLQDAADLERWAQAWFLKDAEHLYHSWKGSSSNKNNIKKTGQGFELSGLVEDVPTYCREVGKDVF